MAPAPVALDADQTRAVELLLQRNVSCLVGAPGTGKTTVLLEVVTRERAAGRRTLIVAPTAKAASRARAVVGVLAVTTTADKLCFGAGAATAHSKWRHQTVVFDETSMVSPLMLSRVLRTLRRPGELEPGMFRLVFVGDPDQLPPTKGVGVLPELMRAYPTVRLERVYRQNSESALYRNISRIRTQIGLCIADLERDDTFEVVDLEECGDGYGFLKKHLTTTNKPAVLCLTNKARHRATKIVQRCVNPEGAVVMDAKYVSKDALVPLRLGDPVVCTKNKYCKSDTEDVRALVRAGEQAAGGAGGAREREAESEGDERSVDEDEEEEHTARTAAHDVLVVSNGTPGVLCVSQNVRCVKYRTVAPNGMEVDFYDEENPHREHGSNAMFLTKFEHAYALTVHKAQGDDFDEVVCVVEAEHAFAKRALLYTAVSRARKRCVLCTTDESLRKMTRVAPGEQAHVRSALSWSFDAERTARARLRAQQQLPGQASA